jgi:hypothetical protein
VVAIPGTLRALSGSSQVRMVDSASTNRRRC